jgi:outer membrane protein
LLSTTPGKEYFMTIRWNVLFPSLLISLCLLSPAAMAEETMKIGFVDMQRALNESAEGKRALDELKALMEEKRTSLQKEKDVIELKKEELDNQGLLLNEATRLEREEEIRRLERDHSRRFSDTKDELTGLEGKYTGLIRTELLELVNVIGKEKNYLLVLEKQFSAILYAPESIDMTDLVIQRFDELKNR